tara:strand:- start:8381 stop:8629 length:249 start_codon:yes stop_codon:yes gene_type:complete
METARTGLAVGLALALAAASPASAQEASLQQCQSLKERIERYTALRRKGGSASRMEGWKKQLRKAEARFRELDCRAYGRELR